MLEANQIISDIQGEGMDGGRVYFNEVSRELFAFLYSDFNPCENDQKVMFERHFFNSKPI